MAQIAPFRGICFNPAQIVNLERVVSPPYDVIDPDLHAVLLQRSPFNIVRLILGDPSDPQLVAVGYQRSAELFEQWQQQQVLQRDDQAAIYLYDQEYCRQGQSVIRKGFIALTRIEDFSSGMVKPHEQTRFDWCRDRLQLLRQCRANFSPVFSLYSDPCCVVEAITANTRNAPAELEVEDDFGVIHRLWRIREPRLISTIQDVLANKPLMIADGHHRYETALNYRDERREECGEFNGKETFNYVSMYFSNMEAPGCQSVPQYRLLVSMSSSRFLELADSPFVVTPLTEHEWQQAVHRLDSWDGSDYAIYFYDSSGTVYSLTLRDGVAAEQSCRHLLACAPAATHQAIMYRAALTQVIGAEDRAQPAVHHSKEAIEMVGRGAAEGVFFIPALAISVIKEIANAGAKIPDSSTCFYPSVLSGLVINPIIAEEQISDFL